VFAEGDQYDGQWYMDMYHGMGTYRNGEGSQYIGMWMKDK